MRAFSFSHNQKKLLAGICTLGAVLASSSAYAGFEWVPVPQQPQVQSAPPAVPAQPVAAEPLAPSSAAEQSSAASAQPVYQPSDLTPLPGETPNTPVIHTLYPAQPKASSSSEAMVAAEAAPVDPSVMQHRVVLPSDAPESAKGAVVEEAVDQAVSEPVEVAKVQDSPASIPQEEIVFEAPADKTPVMPMVQDAAPVSEPSAVVQEIAVEEASEQAPAVSEAAISEEIILFNEPVVQSEAEPAAGDAGLIINPFPQQQMANAEAALSPLEPAGADELQIAEAVGDAPMASVEGFGSDMPLALALRQVVPAAYSFSFGPGVNPGVRVSWSGGKPWGEVVQDMVAPLGLAVRIQERRVHISSAEGVQSMNDAPVVPEGNRGQSLQLSASQSLSVEEAVKSVDAGEDDVRRDAIQDPGEAPSEQPAQTQAALLGEEESDQDVATLEADAQMAAALEPAAGDARADVEPVYQARKGDSLKQTFDDWGRRSNVEVIWQASHDYQIDSDIAAGGGFEEALKSALSSLGEAGDAPMVEFLSRPGQPSRLIVNDQSS
ncbi:MAG: TcpQ domain-containing protein [Alphaproteobacteria bacterium]|nr:TcpQ domain-containing protein [Alphaproteobacteria bacterium]